MLKITKGNTLSCKGKGAQSMKKKTIITISRQFGSGGREVGKKLAEKLGIPFYDKELVAIASEKSGISEDVLEHMDERATNSLLYSLSMGMYGFGPSGRLNPEMPMNDRLFLLQSEIITDAAKEGSCVVVGRCADYLLRDEPDAVHVFLHAHRDKRCERVMQIYDLPIQKAIEMMIKTDKKRASYYNFYTNMKWGNIENYDLSLDTGIIGIDNTVELIAQYVQMRKNFW